ncbi:MAG: hypothetical protein D3910_00385, partial [Candidatus Electrothrix sp. ATG2]|nr:hypothetical protein [Candidatus Electrothrix sp. ATG2]
GGGGQIEFSSQQTPLNIAEKREQQHAENNNISSQTLFLPALFRGKHKRKCRALNISAWRKL